MVNTVKKEGNLICFHYSTIAILLPLTTIHVDIWSVFSFLTLWTNANVTFLFGKLFSILQNEIGNFPVTTKLS